MVELNLRYLHFFIVCEGYVLVRTQAISTLLTDLQCPFQTYRFFIACRGQHVVVLLDGHWHQWEGSYASVAAKSSSEKKFMGCVINSVRCEEVVERIEKHMA